MLFVLALKFGLKKAVLSILLILFVLFNLLVLFVLLPAVVLFVFPIRLLARPELAGAGRLELLLLRLELRLFCRLLAPLLLWLLFRLDLELELEWVKIHQSPFL